MDFYFIQTIFLWKNKPKARITAQWLFSWKVCVSAHLFCGAAAVCCRTGSDAAKPGLLPWLTFLLPMWGWAGALSPFLAVSAPRWGERTVLGAPSPAVLWWRVQVLYCCSQPLHSVLVWHDAVMALAWEIIPGSSSLPERDLALGYCISLTHCFVVC